MSVGYVLTPQAQQDLVGIADTIASSSGPAAAERVVREPQRGFRVLAEQPGVGHVREDLTDDPAVRFWGVFSYLVVFVPASRPLAVVCILHGARDPKATAEHIRTGRTPAD